MRPRRRELIYTCNYSELSTLTNGIIRVHTSSQKVPCASPLLYTSGPLVSAESRHEPAGTLQRNLPMRYSSGSAEGIILPVSRTQDFAGCIWGEGRRASRILFWNRHRLVWLSITDGLTSTSQGPRIGPVLAARVLLSLSW